MREKLYPDFPPTNVCLFSINPKSHQPLMCWRSVLRFVLLVADMGLARGTFRCDDGGDGGIGGTGGTGDL